MVVEQLAVGDCFTLDEDQFRGVVFKIMGIDPERKLVQVVVDYAGYLPIETNIRYGASILRVFDVEETKKEPTEEGSDAE